MLVPVLATVREDEALGLLRMVQGCSHSVPILIDRAHFIKLPANFLQGTRGHDKKVEFRAIKCNLSPENVFSEGRPYSQLRFQ